MKINVWLGEQRRKFNALVGHIALLKSAKQHGFPIWKKGVYIYGCYCWMGPTRFEKWRDHLRGIGIKNDDYAPLLGNGDYVATYRLVRQYRKGYRGSDYAFGDSGKHGDFKLVRIDVVPNRCIDGK